MTMLSPTSANVVGSRYLLLESSGGGNMGVVYRARDLLTSSTVALKRVEFFIGHDELGSTNTTLDLRSALAREFRVLASLRHPHIISVLDYGFDAEKMPYFTMEFLEGAHNIVEAAARLRNDRRRLLGEMLEALAYLHRHGVLHCDLKPDNVLVSASGTSKMLDFGLATAREYLSERGSESYGTLPYAAPELFDLQPNTETSDLYAIGVIAYEMLTGIYPFNMRDSLDALIHSIQHDPVDFSQIDDAPLRPFVARLMERLPERRYQSADEALAEFARIVGQPARETPALRESYLEGARFVGRAGELEALTNGLKRSVEGMGSAWLIGGESGVGKSRMMEELRIRALVRGMRVLSGQATIEEDTPYSMWRAILRGLALGAPLSDFEAGVLKTILPDLGAVLERDIPDAPEIDPAAAQDRALLVIETMLRRQTQPVLLVLEDLHWSRESLAVLRRVARLAPDLPLTVVGTYRNDERPDLPQTLPMMAVMELRRFEETEIQALSVAILGDEVGKRPALIDLLCRETEGNAFFIVQVLRTLAEEAGELGALGATQLPEHVIAGGMQSVIERRLARIPEADRALLEAAAVAGRQLDLALLAALAPTVDREEWLLDCGAVLEINDNQWRFAHDKLRENLLTHLAPERRRALHADVAGALERVYAGASDKVIVLAYHWGQAGDAEKEAHYTLLGGEQFLRQGSYREALEWLRRAESIAAALVWTPHQRARLARRLAEALLGAGKPRECLDYLKRTLQALDIPTPEGADIEPADSTAEAVRAVVERIGVPLGGDRAFDAETLQLITEAELDLGYHYPEQTTEPLAGLIYVFSAAHRLEQVGGSAQLANGYAMLAMALMTGGVPELAADYAGRAESLLLQIDDEHPNTAAALSNLAYYWTFSARWNESARDGMRAATAYQRIGDLLRSRATLMNLAVNEEWRGNFELGMAYRQQEWDIAVRADSIIGKIRALAGIGQLQAWMGRNQEALETFTERKRLVEIVGNTASTRWTYLSMAHYRLGDFAQAAECLPRAHNEIKLIVTPTAHDMFSTTNTAEVALGLWERGDESVRPYADNAIRVVEAYGKRYLSGRPLMNVFIGRYLWLAGDQTRARARWQEALDLSAEIGTRYAEALAHYEIGRHLPASAQRDAHLAAARTAFKAMGTLWSLRQIDALG